MELKPYYVFTAYRTLKTYCKCDICGEWYEADRLHLCKTRNSYPEIEESEEEDDFFTKGHLHLGYAEEWE